jgi:hypothetical protein
MALNFQFFNFQKPGANDSQNEGQIRLNGLLLQLLKQDKTKQPDKYSQTVQTLTDFLNHDERAPKLQNPFLGTNSLKIVVELGKRQQLPSLNSGLQADNTPWHWGEGLGSLLIAAKLTETKNLTAAEIQNHAKELAKNPNPDPIQFQQTYEAAAAPYQALLEKFLGPAELVKYKESLESEGKKILTDRLGELKRRGHKLGVPPEETAKIQESILNTQREARKFANSEEYIQHRVARFGTGISIAKFTGRRIGDATIATGIVFFAPTTVVPFIIAGYLGHKLSTLNVNTLKDWREQGLRNQVQRAAAKELEKDTTPAKDFASIPHTLSGYLKKLQFLPRPIQKDLGKTQTVPNTP